ncbi:hypothetical protein V1291_004964 [Nitrobacteraceae bacterium AZCC 1564]
MRKFAVSFVLLFFLQSCGPLISDYSIDAYKNATTLKAETEALVNKSGQPYASLKNEIDAHTTKINAAYEFSAGLPYNSLSTQQWQILRDPDGALYGWFVKYWKQQGTVSPVFRAEFRQQLNDAYDAIICLEANKKAAAACHPAAVAAAESAGGGSGAANNVAKSAQKRQ